METTHKMLRNSYNYTIDTKIKDIICTCNENKASLKKILNVTDTMEEVIAYPNCPRVLFTAFMRQLRESPNAGKMDVREIHNFKKYSIKFFEDRIKPLLENFTYDVEAWMNHLKTYNKQLEVIPYYEKYKQGIYYEPEWEDDTYTLFAKKEKQIITTEADGTKKYPKCRAISACPANVKWIMGPVVLAIEEILGNNLKGYKINNGTRQFKNWEDQEQFFTEAYQQGFTKTMSVDGSAWDSTQTAHMKTTSRMIYKWLVDNDKIRHVDSQLFLTIAMKKQRRLVAKAYVNKQTEIIFAALVNETQFSGSPSTTCDNTVADTVVTSYSVEKIIEEEQYKLACTGDDGLTLLKPSELIDNGTLATSVKNTWEKLGLVPKYVLIGGYTSSSYCSTDMIHYMDKGTDQIKIVRQMDRMNPLGHWSIKALQYSKANMKHHYEQLALGMRNWCRDMPLYRSYADAYHEMYKSIEGPSHQRGDGIPKVHFKTDKVYNHDDYSDEAKFQNRISRKNPPKHVIEDFLLEKYGLSTSDIREIENNISAEVNFLPIPAVQSLD